MPQRSDAKIRVLLAAAMGSRLTVPDRDEHGVFDRDDRFDGSSPGRDPSVFLGRDADPVPVDAVT